MRILHVYKLSIFTNLIIQYSQNFIIIENVIYLNYLLNPLYIESRNHLMKY